MADQPAGSSVRVVLTGAMQSGKTSYIRALSDIAVLTAQRAVAAGPGGEDSIPLDFGRMTLQDGLDMQLFGASAVGSLAALDGIVGPGLLGVIMLVGHGHDDTIDNSRDIAIWLRDTWEVPWVVGVTHVPDGQEERAINRAKHALRLPEHVTISAIDARETADARRLLLQLITAAQEN